MKADPAPDGEVPQTFDDEEGSTEYLSSHLELLARCGEGYELNEDDLELLKTSAAALRTMKGAEK